MRTTRPRSNTRPATWAKQPARKPTYKPEPDVDPALIAQMIAALDAGGVVRPRLGGEFEALCEAQRKRGYVLAQRTEAERTASATWSCCRFVPAAKAGV